MTGSTPPTPPAPEVAPAPEPGDWAAPQPLPPTPNPDPNGTGWVPPPALPARKPSPFRSAGVRARWLLWLLWANVVLAIVGVAISSWGKFLLAEFEAERATIADLDRFDSIFALSGTIESAAFIAGAVAWLAWSSRTIDNEDALGIGPSSVTPALSIAWWFLPFANLVMPYLTHKEIYERYHRGLAVGAGIVLVWWLVYLANGVIGVIILGTWTAAETFDQLQSGLTMYVVSDLVAVCAALIAIVMVRRIQTRADVLAATGPPVTTPIAATPSAT
jgi:hypothetical protein